MQKSIFLVFLLVFFSFDKPKLTRVKVAEGISVLVPKSWRPMDELDFTARYPSVRAPLAAYSDEDRLMDLSINISATQWPDANMEMARLFFKAAILNSFDRVEMIDEGIHELKKGKKYIYFEFESTVKGDRNNLSHRETVLRYSYLQYLVEPGRTLVFSFHCPRRRRAEWQEAAREIMESVKVK